MRKSLLRRALSGLALGVLLTPLAAGQTETGGSTKSRGGQDANGNSTAGGRGGGRGESGGSKPPRPAPKPARCGEGEITVKCSAPGCAVFLNGSSRGTTDPTGELRFSAPSGTHTVVASKPYHEDASAQVRLGCGEPGVVELRPRAKTVRLRVRTSLPECEIYVNGSAAPVGRSDAQGVFDFNVIPSPLLVEARKKGYLSKTQRANVSADGGVREVSLTLEPIKASLTVRANVEGARVSVDGAAETQPAAERVLLPPGRRRVTVTALGYAPSTFEVTPGPDDKLTQPVALERLPAAELMSHAERLYAQRAFRDVLTLCGYALEADGNNPTAHRLAGLTYLAEQDFARAGPHLEKALAGGETVRLQVRRHPRESFDLNKGHNDCEAVLLLRKSEVEFQGLRDASENYKVPYEGVEVTGIQLKKNAALYLGARVAVARGRKKEYNFYSFDNELSQAGRPFLNLLQLLLRSH